jgi:hypothetical protein
MLGVAVGAATSSAAGWALGLAVGALCAWALERASWELRVDEAGFHLGPVLLPASNVGDAESLDPTAARRLRGVDADARAFIVIRGWVRTAARVDVADDLDPTPYWMVSTRRPVELASALAALRQRR